MGRSPRHAVEIVCRLGARGDWCPGAAPSAGPLPGQLLRDGSLDRRHLVRPPRSLADPLGANASPTLAPDRFTSVGGYPDLRRHDPGRTGLDRVPFHGPYRRKNTGFVVLWVATMAMTYPSTSSS